MTHAATWARERASRGRAQTRTGRTTSTRPGAQRGALPVGASRHTRHCAAAAAAHAPAMPHPASSRLAVALLCALVAIAGAQEQRCPDVSGVNFAALALRCAPDVTGAPGGARLSRAACDACASALTGALAPLFVRAPRAGCRGACILSNSKRNACCKYNALATGFFADAGSFHCALQLDQNVPMTGACLPSLMPPLAAAGADVAALTACAGVLGGGGIASAPMPGAPVRYSPACAALPLAPSFSPAWLSRATAGCLVRGACDAPCLRRVRDFLRAFARAGCVDEYFTAQRSAAAKQQAGPATGATSSSNAAAAAAARLALEERAVAALLPVVAAGADDLACARNAAGDFCLSFTDALPAQPSASASPSLGAALLAPAAAPAAASGAGAMDANPATRCAAWAQMGCCAPLVASLGLRAASALTAAVGYADAVAPAPAGAPPPGAAADAAAACALIGQLNAQCGRALGAAAPNISVAPCGAADAYLDAARYDPPATVSVSRAVMRCALASSADVPHPQAVVPGARWAQAAVRRGSRRRRLRRAHRCRLVRCAWAFRPAFSRV